MGRKISYEKVKEEFNNKGFDMITSKNEYKKTSEKVIVIDKEGYLYTISYHKLMLGRTPFRYHVSNPFTIYNIKRYLLLNKPKYKYVSGSFKNTVGILTFKHLECDKEFQTSWGCMLNSRSSDGGCSHCFKNNLKTHTEFLEDLHKRNKHYRNGEFKVISDYKGDNKKMIFECIEYKHQWYTTPSSILSNGSGCAKCFYINNRGENNASWNPSLTNEDREGKRTFKDNSHSIWRNQVFTRDNGICQIIGRKYIKKETRGNQRFIINAHHLNGYHWDKENRFNVDNGITLCKPIHDLFHKIYGKKNNTKEQFDEFLIRIDSGEFDNYLVYNLPLRIWINFKTS